MDNLGGTADSSPRFLVANGTPGPGGDQPKLGIRTVAPKTMRLIVNGPPGDYIIEMSEDLKTWVDIYPLTIDAGGSGSIDDAGGPLHYANLFYRVRRN
jgi:hypothetical protein